MSTVYWFLFFLEFSLKMYYWFNTERFGFSVVSESVSFFFLFLFVLIYISGCTKYFSVAQYQYVWGMERTYLVFTYFCLHESFQAHNRKTVDRYSFLFFSFLWVCAFMYLPVLDMLEHSISNSDSERCTNYCIVFVQIKKRFSFCRANRLRERFPTEVESFLYRVENR